MKVTSWPDRLPEYNAPPRVSEVAYTVETESRVHETAVYFGGAARYVGNGVFWLMLSR